MTPKQQIKAWFGKQGWRIFAFQRSAWRAYAKDESGLIHSPTGTGKSLAAWLGPVLAHADFSAKNQNKTPPPITVLWITPLRALAVDTAENLRRPITDLGLNWQVATRTGDTSATERNKQRKRLPTALITTPESLSLLLSYAETAKQLEQLRCVVVDEWHELLGSKRGVLLQLSLERLRGMNPALRTWGLSATIGNIPQAAEALLGPERAARIIDGKLNKRNRITGIIPPEIVRFPWAGHMGLKLLPQVLQRLEQAQSTLLFTNTRAQAEKWFEALILAKPDWLGHMALHHGSLDPKLRRKVEDLLRKGELRVCVATSSLDLGVDFSPVEQVIQIGSPKGVARLLQRAGRSGHQPGAISEVFCAPSHALELVEIAAAKAAAAAGEIEAREPPRLALDVLSQHLVTQSLAGGINPDQILLEARRTHAFAGLSDAAWGWILDFVTRGGPALQNYPQYHRVVWEQGLLKPASRKAANWHRMAIGTINANAQIKVKFQTGGYLGTVEERFIARLKPGDAFQFAGRTLELVRMRDMVAQVRLSRSKRVTIPRWDGGRLPLSTELANALQNQFSEYEAGAPASPELRAAAPLLALQKRWSALPTPDRLVIERAKSRDGFSLFFYPFAGRLVHEGLAALLAWRLARRQPITFSIAVNDYGFELLSRDAVPFESEALRAVLSAGNLSEDILLAINGAELAKRQFRDIARIAGLVFQGYPGAQKSARQVQASTSLIYDVLVQYDPDNELPKQALREVLEGQFELTRLRRVLERIAGQTLVLRDTERLTPLAFPLWAERLGARLSSESWRERVEKMRLALEQAADNPKIQRKTRRNTKTRSSHADH